MSNRLRDIRVAHFVMNDDERQTTLAYIGQRSLEVKTPHWRFAQQEAHQSPAGGAGTTPHHENSMQSCRRQHFRPFFRTSGNLRPKVADDVISGAYALCRAARCGCQCIIL